MSLFYTNPRHTVQCTHTQIPLAGNLHTSCNQIFPVNLQKARETGEGERERGREGERERETERHREKERGIYRGIDRERLRERKRETKIKDRYSQRKICRKKSYIFKPTDVEEHCAKEWQNSNF